MTITPILECSEINTERKHVIEDINEVFNRHVIDENKWVYDEDTKIEWAQSRIAKYERGELLKGSIESLLRDYRCMIACLSECSTDLMKALMEAQVLLDNDKKKATEFDTEKSRTDYEDEIRDLNDIIDKYRETEL